MIRRSSVSLSGQQFIVSASQARSALEDGRQLLVDRLMFQLEPQSLACALSQYI
jgi:hypothetical protein